MSESPEDTRAETPEHRLKRLKMRAWRRGTKEMDMVLGPFADANLAGLNAGDLVLFDRLLWENDQEIHGWVTGKAPVPAPYEGLLAQIKKHAFET